MDFAQDTVIEPSAGTSSPEGGQRPKKVHDEANSVASPVHFVEPKDDAMEDRNRTCTAAMEQLSADRQIMDKFKAMRDSADLAMRDSADLAMRDLADLAIRDILAIRGIEAAGVQETADRTQKIQKLAKEHILNHISQQKDAAHQHLRTNDFEGFNLILKQVNSLADAFPQLRLSVHAQELETKFKKEVLDGCRQAITSAQSVKDAADGCEALRKLADQARDTYDLVRSALETALNGLGRTVTFQNGGMLLLAEQLHMTPVGQVILAEHPGVFDGAVKDAVTNAVNNEIFYRAPGTLYSDEVVGRLTVDSKLNVQEYWELRRALEQHEKSLAELTKKYLFGGKTLEQVKEEAKNDLREAVRACGTNTCSSVQNVLTHLAACYMLVKSGKTFLEATPSEQAQLFQKLTRPHWVQMLVLFRFLQAHKERQGDFDPLWRWIFGPANSRVAENHLAQVKTGEGKCLILNMTAAFFALRGLKADIVCYQKALMEQDSRAMLEFNEFLAVDQMIRHVTFDDLCQERLDPIVAHSKALLTGELPTARQVCVKNRVLLIDEVDMLFTQRFYGWNGGFTLNSPAATELVKYIFEARSCGKEIPNITSTPVFQKLLAEQPEQIHRSLALAAHCLVKNWENWNEPMPELNEAKTQVGYSGVVDIDWSLSHRNKTVFAYLQFAKDGDITPEVAESKIGVDLIAGMFSFADLPRSYKYILGVTGTLSELRKIPGLEETLRNDYDFKHFTIAPSIFGRTKLRFRYASDVRLCDNEPDWISEIESAIKACTDQGQSVLVFFKNQKELQKFPNWQKYELLTKSTDPKRISGYVAAATNKGKVTLLTKTFGRGLDFQMKESTVVVIQTFLSSSESYQTHIQGRTARKGSYGEYQLILCSDHLQAKMGFGDDDLKVLRSGDGDQIRILLKKKQQEKTLLKVKKMHEHRNIASRQEDRTKQWEQLLFSNAAREVKLSKLAAWNEENFTLHCTLLLDISGSMLPSWSQLTRAVQRFKNEVAQNSRVANSTKVSVILFNHSAHVVRPTHCAVADMPDLNLQTCGGGTSFSAAFSECRQVMCQSPPESNEFILFFTDALSADSEKVQVSEINALLKDHGSRISGLTCIAFGREAGKNALFQIGGIFKTYKSTIDFKLQEACSEESLIRCFADAVTSLERSMYGDRDHPDIAETLHTLGQVSQQAGDLQQAKLHLDESLRKEKKNAIETANFDKSDCSSSRPGGRKNAAKNSIPSPGFTAVMDRMYEKTDLFAKRWGELQSFITSEKAHRLARKIRNFYTTVDQEADKTRQKLQAPAASSSVVEKGTFKDLQGNLALTARKIYESAKGVPDEEKCRVAAEFVEKVHRDFKRTDVAVVIFLRRCLLSVEFACPKLRSDRETVMAAVQQDGLALQLASEKLQNTKEVVIAAVQNNGLALQFASEELQSDREVVIAAVQQDGRACLFASEDVRRDKELAMVTAEKGRISHQFACEELNYDRHFNDVLQSTDVSPAMADFYRTLKAFIDANQTHLSQSTSLLELLDKSHKLQQVVVLHQAMEKFVREGNVWLRELIKGGVDLNQEYRHPQQPPHESLTPLRHAVTLDSPEIIKLLCKEGADLCSKPSPIRYAHDLGSTANAAFAALAQYPECFRAPDIIPEIITRLAKAGADVDFADARGRTALHFHAVEGHVEVVMALLENDARLDQRDSEGKTPFDLATEVGAPEENDHGDIVRCLLRAWCEEGTELSVVESTALAKFPECLKISNITVRTIEKMGQAGVNVNFPDQLGRTALHVHAVEGHLEVVRALLANGARLDQRDSDGKTPLNLATQAGAAEELLKLLDYVELHIGLGGQPIALPTSLLAEPPDVVSFLKHYVRDMKFKNGERVSYFTIRVAIGDKVAENITSWESAGKPKIIFVTLGCNFREDRERAKQFLKAAARRGADADYELRGHLEEYQDPDALDHEGERGETAAYKAARNGDVDKLELLYLACANFDLQDSGGATALFIASQNGHLATVRFLLDHRAQVDLPLHTNATPLYVSCQNGHLQVAEILLAFGAVPNSQTDDEATPLFIAAQMGHFGIVKKLLEFNGDIKLANRTKATPLFIAAQNDHDDIAMCLLRAGSDINACTNGGASPTYIAAQKGCMKVLALLMEAPGVDANLSAKDGATPILIAAQNGHQEAVRFLLKKKVDVTKAMKSGATALFVAAQNGYLEVVQDLVAANKSLVNMCLQNGTSPLYVAAQNGHLDVVKYLQQEGADTRKKACGGASPFFIAAQNGHVTVVRFLLDVECGSTRPDIETQLTEQTDDGSAPLLVAAQNGHFDVVQFLTSELKKLPVTEERKQQLIDHQKKGGASALYLASQNGHESVVYHLIQLGASVNQALDTKETALFIASQGGHTLIAQHLLEARGDVNQGKHDQTTPLYIASQNNHTDTFRLLLHERADPNVQNANGATPLFISSQKGHKDIVRELLDTNADPELAIKSGACPLYIAAMKGECEVCTSLLWCGRGNVNKSPDTHGTSPLLISIRNGDVEVADSFLKHPKVDVNKADFQGNTPLLTAIKENLWNLVEKLISRCAKVDHGIFDDGIAILRGLAEALVSIAPAARALQRSEIPLSGYPHADASAESLEQYREFFKKTSEEAKTLLHQLHKVDEGLRNLANESLSSGTKQQVEQLRKLFQKVPDPDKGSWTCGNLSLADLFQSVHKVVKASHYNDRLLDPGEAREKLLMAGSQVLHACSLMRVYIAAAEKVFLPFLKRCSGHGCVTAEKDRMQQLITKQICSELLRLQASELEGGLETLFKPMGTDFTAKPVCQSIGTVDSGAKPVCESTGVEDFTLKPGMPGKRSVYTTKSA